MIITVTLNPTIDRTMRFARLALGELNRATHSRTDLSGKGVNVSVALRRFGIQTVTMGFIAGAYGQVLLEGLGAAGHICDFSTVEGETRSNITVIDEASGVTTKLNEPGPTVTEKDLSALERRLLERTSEGDLCVFSGSLPPGAPADTYSRLITKVKKRRAYAALDTSGAALVAGCEARPDFVKPNAQEASNLVGMLLDSPAHLRDSMRAILALGPSRVLLSLAGRGAALADGHGLWLAEPPPVEEISAVGAGDALLAGGLWAWSQGMPPEEILRWATAAGTATAMEDGSAIPSLARIKEVYSTTEVIRLE